MLTGVTNRPNVDRDRIRALGPWLLRDALRVTLVLLLAAVSAYYLTRWAVHNRIPIALAWTLPIMFDCSALLGIVVARYPRDDQSQRKAIWFAWTAAGLSAVGNGAMHAVDFGAVHVTLWTVVATGAVYPLMLAAGYDVAGGMQARPGRKLSTARAPKRETRPQAAELVPRPTVVPDGESPQEKQRRQARDRQARRRARQRQEAFA
jgi:hypothetical protein